MLDMSWGRTLRRSVHEAFVSSWHGKSMSRLPVIPRVQLGFLWNGVSKMHVFCRRIYKFSSLAANQWNWASLKCSISQASAVQFSPVGVPSCPLPHSASGLKRTRTISPRPRVASSLTLLPICWIVCPPDMDMYYITRLRNDRLALRSRRRLKGRPSGWRETAAAQRQPMDLAPSSNHNSRPDSD
jgi:hypothetical protein